MDRNEYDDFEERSEKYVRTNVVIDANLLEDALSYSNHKTRRAVIDEALRFFVRMSAQQEMRKLRGKVDWVGDLDEMRVGVRG